MASHTTDTAIGRRDFARMTLGTLGVAALAGRAAGPCKAVRQVSSVRQSPANPSDEQLLFLNANGAATQRRLAARAAHRGRVPADQETLRGRRDHRNST